MTFDQIKAKYLKSHEEYNLHPETAWIDPFQVFGPIYYVGDKKVCVHLVDTGDGLLLIDAGFPHTVHMLTESIYRLGFNPKDICMILHTHGHFDHFGASEAFRRLYGCSLAISRTDAQWLKREPGIGLTELCEVVSPLCTVPTFDVLIENGEKITMGNITVECLPIPGHTPGAMAFFMDVSDGERTVRAGLFGGAGKGSLSMAELTMFGEPVSLRDDMLNSLDTMAEEHVDVMLGNHPANNDTLGRRARQLKGEKDAFVDPEAWPAFLKKTRAEFEKYYMEDPCV